MIHSYTIRSTFQVSDDIFLILQKFIIYTAFTELSVRFSSHYSSQMIAPLAVKMIIKIDKNLIHVIECLTTYIKNIDTYIMEFYQSKLKTDKKTLTKVGKVS